MALPGVGIKNMARWVVSNMCFFTPKFGEMIQFDSYFSIQQLEWGSMFFSRSEFGSQPGYRITSLTIRYNLLFWK